MNLIGEKIEDQFSEQRFTEALQRGQMCVERAFQALQRQFLALHTELQWVDSNTNVAALHAISTGILQIQSHNGNENLNAAVCLCNLCIATSEFTFDDGIPSTSRDEDADLRRSKSEDEEGSEQDSIHSPALFFELMFGLEINAIGSYQNDLNISDNIEELY